MLKAAEDKLRQVADRYASQGKLKRKMGDSLEEAKDRFVFGILRHKSGWKPKREQHNG